MMSSPHKQAIGPRTSSLKSYTIRYIIVEKNLDRGIDEVVPNLESSDFSLTKQNFGMKT